MFGMHKGTQCMHLRLRLTACKKKKKRNIPFHVGNLDYKTVAWICFTACVVVTSDTMSLTLEFQSDSVKDG